MNNKGISRVALSFIIVGLFALGLFSFAAYKANNPDTDVVITDINGISTTTDKTNDTLQTGIVPKNTNESENESDDDDRTSIPVTPSPTTPPPVDMTKRSTKYKDGSYTAVGSYDSPGGMNEIGISLTLSGDIVTSVSATAMANDGVSEKYQNKFLSGYQALVVGRNIDTLQIGKVSGSSLTGIGFNDAISKIKMAAKV